MIILGIPLHWPANKDLAMTAGLTIGWALMIVLLNKMGVVENEAVPVSTAAVLTGSLAHGFGISIAKNCWRACVLFGVILSILLMLLKIAGL